MTKTIAALIFITTLSFAVAAVAKKAAKTTTRRAPAVTENFEIQHDKSVTLKDGFEFKFYKWEQETTAPAPDSGDVPQMFFSVTLAIDPNSENPEMLKIEEMNKPYKWKAYTFTVTHVQLDREPRTVKVRVQK